jgi:hypothetical protein
MEPGSLLRTARSSMRSPAAASFDSCISCDRAAANRRHESGPQPPFSRSEVGSLPAAPISMSCRLNFQALPPYSDTPT